MIPLDSRIARWAPIPLRLIVGYGFMEHGFAKLARGPEAFPAILHALGVPAPHFLAWASILTEVLGGLAVILGAFVALVALPMAALLVVAIFTVHLPYGFSSIKLLSVTAAGAQFGPPGYELNLLYLACLAALVLGGSGPLAKVGQAFVGMSRPLEAAHSGSAPICRASIRPVRPSEKLERVSAAVGGDLWSVRSS
jgi:putative oxidoreductase